MHTPGKTLAPLARSIVAVLAGLLLWAPTVAAQEPAESGSAPADQRPVAIDEEIRVNLIEIPILAVDRNGSPITDLRADELEVRLSGRKIDVGFLKPFIQEANDLGPLPRVRLRVELPGGGPSVVTSGKEEVRRILIFIDIENDQPLGKARAASQLVRFVMEDLDPSYRVAVLSFNGEVNIETSFTSDRRLAADAIRAGFDRPPRPNLDLSLRIRQLIDRFDDCVTQKQDFISRGNQFCMESVALEYADEVRPRATAFLGALEGVINYAAGLSGRKSVLAVTHGVATEPAQEVLEVMKAVMGDTMELNEVYLALLTNEGAGTEFDRLLTHAVQQEVTLHMIDRTLDPPELSSARSNRLFTPGSQPVGAAFAAAQSASKQIARTTGGVFISSQDLHKAVQEAVDAERGAYSVGVYLDYYLPRDKLSKVSVKSTRKEVRIRHQRGTYAREQRPGAGRPFRGVIGLGRPQRVAGDNSRIRMPFQIAAEARDLGYRRVDDAAAVAFTVHVELKIADGRTAVDSYHLVHHGYPWSLWMEGDVEPVLIEGWFEAPRGKYTLVARFANPTQDIQGEISREIDIASRAAESDASKPPAGEPLRP